MKAIDLYSGIGGWTLGFKMAGIEVVASYEWWKDANRTHNANFGTKHEEKNIRDLDLVKDLPSPEEINFVIGSPPCTQFSFANRGGNGDITDGLVDIYKFLEVVDYLKPEYWAMENVPRVAGIIEREIEIGGALHRFAHLFDGDFRVIKVYNSSDYGVPQNRKRMIAGCFPYQLFEGYQDVTPRRTLREVIETLKKEIVHDPIYGHKIDILTDNIFETPLSDEERRMNSDSKTHHPVYNKMSFPDDLDRPSRTVTALCTRVSRESIVIEDKDYGYRRLTVRERGCVQSFPADYQYHSNSYGGKLKMIGNAVPPLLTYYIAQSMLGKTLGELKKPKSKGNIVNPTSSLPKVFSPEGKGSKFAWSRSFWLAIPNLRLGSGVRFELRNKCDKENYLTSWCMNFFYGNSKKILSYKLEREKFGRIWEELEMREIEGLKELLIEFQEFVELIDIGGLQENWTNKNRQKNGPIELVDKIGEFANDLISLLESSDALAHFSTVDLIKSDSEGLGAHKKLMDNSILVLSGILLGCIFNSEVSKEKINLELEPQC